MLGQSLYLFVFVLFVLREFSFQVCGERACGRLEERQLYNDNAYAEQDEHPWLGRLVYKNQSESFIFHCVAVLLSVRHVLAPASCFKGSKVYEYTPHAVLFDTSSDCAQASSHARMFKIEKIIVHPDYKNNTLGDDLAVVRLDRDVPFSAFVQPICMPHSWDGPATFVAANVDLIGYEMGNNTRSRRIKAYAHVSDPQSCVLRYPETRSQLCGYIKGAELQPGSPLIGVRVEKGIGFWIIFMPIDRNISIQLN
ncbi:CLIP domain-containing serine protease 2-like [Drosophila guanche]|uniref:CLIP domain-containing serine protease 2-like n=1 Tax=Drosophila guanche TaxID=7266 RepID=UPI001470D44A|nr:CLIP domain-containing serine protease 2-like [Drosophila guanche]